jgi:3',5'-cyclic-AMP phosphodiesterase
MDSRTRVTPTYPSDTIALDETGILSWVHFGDLHITTATAENYGDFLALISDANRHLKDGIAFAVLPGDNAENGTEEQYRLVRHAIDGLEIPLFIIPGDHDVHTGSLDFFRRYLEPRPVRAVSAGDYRCIFLDAVNQAVEVGKPGAFGLRDMQLAWLECELQAATRETCHVILFNHVYPSELGDSSEAVRELMRRHRVIMVDMGHTHYNEIANDGHTIYASTRSTGQIEEGSVGFSIANLDDGVVSWKFKPLDVPWPFVMITAPADRALIVDPTHPEQLVRGIVEVRAKAWDERDVVSADCRIDDEPWRPMSRIGARPVWSCPWDSFLANDGIHDITVRVQSADGHTAADKISALVSQSGHYQAPPCHHGDDSNAIGAYPEKGILGTQLGPNKNGRKW